MPNVEAIAEGSKAAVDLLAPGLAQAAGKALEEVAQTARAAISGDSLAAPTIFRGVDRAASVSMRDVITGNARSEFYAPLPELTLSGDPATGIKTATSMRELMDSRNYDAADKIMRDYYPQLQKVFPQSEIENADTYMSYLTDKHFPWDMVVLRNPDREIMGGIQYQKLNVGGRELKSAVWGEHVWLREEGRNMPNFSALMGEARDRFTATGARQVMMEFNDPLKMTDAEKLEDASMGVAPERRVNLWNRVGIKVLVDSEGKAAQYAQPGMDGEAPVKFLTLGHISADPLTDSSSMLTSDYLKMAHAAHRTIDGVAIPNRLIPDLNSAYKGDNFLKAIQNFRPAGKLETDPTVLEYTRDMLERNEPRLRYKSLTAYLKDGGAFDN